MKRERLFARIPVPRVSKTGISANDIDRILVLPELPRELVECLRSQDEGDLIFGLYFSERLGLRADFCSIASSSLPEIAALVRSALDHSSERVRAGAVRALVTFRSNYSDYVTIMRELLTSPEASTREEALAAASTFLSQRDLHLLLPFQHDTLASETGGMGGPLRYAGRDHALEVAERIAGKSFANGDCFERRDGAKVSWRSWSRFVQWLETRGRGFWRSLLGRSK
jgi:HEAT repeat protein